MQRPKTFRPWQPDQTTLPPLSPFDWLSAVLQVGLLPDLVNELVLSQVLIPALARDPCGEKGLDPQMEAKPASKRWTFFGPIPHGPRCPGPKVFCAAAGRMVRKPGKKAGCEIHAKRKTIVEPVFAQTNEARGLRRFRKR